jgi:ubiquinone/menaquinone biosynthesis C-methylase UbiE
MEQTQKTYLPAAGHELALPLYDPLNKLLGSDGAKKALLDLAGIRPDDRVLDIGCGTGTLATRIKREYRSTEVTGLDPDPKALARASQKARRAGVAVRFDRGYADELPYPDASFDRVFSSFMFHHLLTDQRANTLREVRRVLAPGGSFYLLDLVRPEEQMASWWTRRLYSNPHLKDNLESRILALMSQAGFASPKNVKRGSLLFGLIRISYFEASVSMQGTKAKL